MFFWMRRFLKAELLRLQVSEAEARGKASGLERRVEQQDTIIGFLCARVNQLERERVVLLQEVTKIAMPIAPQLAAVVERPVDTRSVGDKIAEIGAGMFEDMGDAAAARDGIRWNAAGGVEYDADKAKNRADRPVRPS